MQEVLPQRLQVDSENRRWFISEGCELFVWTDRRGRLTAFEFCYHDAGDEHVLGWRSGYGLRHARVDERRATGGHAQTPLIVPNGHWHLGAILSRFEKAAAGGADPCLEEVRGVLMGR